MIRYFLHALIALTLSQAKKVEQRQSFRAAMKLSSDSNAQTHQSLLKCPQQANLIAIKNIDRAMYEKAAEKDKEAVQESKKSGAECQLTCDTRCAAPGLCNATVAGVSREKFRGHASCTGLKCAEEKTCLLAQNKRPSVVKGPTRLQVNHFDDVAPSMNLRLLDTGLLRPDAEMPRECAREVPKILHLIHISCDVPKKIYESVAAFANLNPNWAIWLWTDRPFSSEVRAYFNKSVKEGGPVVEKSVLAEMGKFKNSDIMCSDSGLGVGQLSDMLRVEVLHLHGGMYIDTDSVAKHSFDSYGDLFKWPIVTFSKDYQNLCNCWQSTHPGSLFTGYYLDAIRERFFRFGSTDVYRLAGCHTLTSVYRLYKRDDILPVDQGFLVHDTPNAVMYQGFWNSWR